VELNNCKGTGINDKYFFGISFLLEASNLMFYIGILISLLKCPATPLSVFIKGKHRAFPYSYLIKDASLLTVLHLSANGFFFPSSK
jgi:hypothetical protein